MEGAQSPAQVHHSVEKILEALLGGERPEENLSDLKKVTLAILVVGAR